MTFEECIKYAKTCAEGEKQLYDDGGWSGYYEQISNYLECLNKIATLYFRHRAFGEYPTTKEEYADETMNILEKYKIEIWEKE